MLTSAGTHNTAIGLTASAGGIENQFAADKTYTIKNADNDLSIVLTDDSSTAANEKIVLTNTMEQLQVLLAKLLLVVS